MSQFNGDKARFNRDETEHPAPHARPGTVPGGRSGRRPVEARSRRASLTLARTSVSKAPGSSSVPS